MIHRATARLIRRPSIAARSAFDQAGDFFPDQATMWVFVGYAIAHRPEVLVADFIDAADRNDIFAQRPPSK